MGLRVMKIGQPTSDTRISRSSSAWRCSASRSCVMHRPRNAWSSAHFVSSNARRAAATAASTSATVASGVGPISCSV